MSNGLIPRRSLLPCSIGAAVARRIVADGGHVAIADLNADAGAALVEDLGQDRAFFVHCDVRCALQA